MRKLFIPILFITCIFLLTACKQNFLAHISRKLHITSKQIPVKSQQPQADQNRISLIFLQQAQFATLKESTLHSGFYLLTLHNVNPYIIYFTQRPDRKKNIVPLQNFVNAWAVGPNSFADNNPNAVIIATNINNTLNKNSPPLIVTLSQPRYDLNKNILQFLVKPLSSQTMLFHQINYDYVTIFIS